MVVLKANEARDTDDSKQAHIMLDMILPMAESKESGAMISQAVM